MPKSSGSDLDSGKQAGSKGIEVTKPWDTGDDVPWSLLEPEQLADAYWEVVAPAMRAEGMDPEEERPTYEWLSANGFRGLTYSLSEYHDMTLSEFWTQTLGLRPEREHYDWDINDEATRESFEKYLSVKASDAGWSESTRETIRYRLARYARSYRERHGTDDLLTPVVTDSDVEETDAVDQCRATFRNMSEEYADRTVARVHDAIRAWYDWLVDRRVSSFNPTNGAEDWFDWSRQTEDDPVALNADHVRAMYDQAAGTKERLLVVALCGWGLRAGEVAALHEAQLVLNADQPHLRFDERKNGPGTVAIVYGADVARDRMTVTSSEYLFPSATSKTAHVYPSTIANWFHDLADRASVPETIDGYDRKPHMGRRFWYDAYSQTIEDLLEHVEDIAAEQGSSSARTVLNDYLSEERSRELRREYMRERLAAAFTNERESRPV